MADNTIVTYLDSSQQEFEIIGELAQNALGDLAEAIEVEIGDAVTSIGNRAFYGCNLLTNVIIADDVSSIGNEAFRNCIKLVNVDIPDTVINIGEQAFNSCSDLTDITIPDGIISIGTGTFNDCRSLTDIVIPDSVISIGSFSFQNCSNLSSISIEDDVTDIGNYAFRNCSSLTDFIIPDPDDGLNIGMGAFYGCSNLSSIEIPNSMLEIKSETFQNCSSLTSINIGENLSSIGDLAFAQCINLSSIAIPDNVIRIAAQAFLDCSGLTSIMIPNSVAYIGNKALSNCQNATVTFLGRTYNDIAQMENHYWGLPRGVYQIIATTKTTVTYSDGSTQEFEIDSVVEQDSLGDLAEATAIEIGNTVTSIGYQAFYNCSKLTSIVMPNTIDSIGIYAFQDCCELTSIAIPESVTYIGSGAFSGCSKLQAISVNANNQSYESTDSGLLLTKGGHALIAGVNGAVVVPDSVSRIESYAFSGYSNLTQITLPDTIETIDDSAFSDCINILDISISNNVTSIGNNAFSGCNNITVTFLDRTYDDIAQMENHYWGLPRGVYQIIAGELAHKTIVTFANNAISSFEVNGALTQTIRQNWESQSGYSVQAVKVGTGVTSIGDYVFRNCNNLTGIIIPDSVTSIGYQAFLGCNNLSSITIPDSVTSIEGWAFYNCSNLSSITISDSVSSIGSQVFYGCTSLVSMTIPDSVTSIGNLAFHNCSSLSSIAIPDSVISIGNNAFNGCSNLSSITIPDGVISIELATFLGCSNLSSITIPDSVSSIGGSAFRNCYNLSSITIPDSVPRLEYQVFCDCHSLSSIIIPDSVTYIGSGTFSNCFNLSSITIPDSVTHIEYQAFSGCSSLTDITIPDSVSSIGTYAFDNCSNVIVTFLDRTYDDVAQMKNYYWGLPRGVDQIIADESIGKTIVTYSDGSTQKFSIQGELVQNALGDLTEATSIEIGNTVTSIGTNVFSESFNLTNIIIPDSITNIRQNAFNGCTSLRNVTIPQYVCNSRMAIIFSSAYQLITNVIISDGVTQIGNELFGGCYELTSILIPDSITNIGNHAFGHCNNIKNITLPNSVIDIGKYTFEYCNELININIPNNVISIGDYTFFECSSLSSITIPDSVTSIGGFAFRYCSSLSSITIPDSVTSIGESAFSECSSLTGITIPDSVTNIGMNAFNNCNNVIVQFLDRTYDDVAQMGNHYWGLPRGVDQIITEDTPNKYYIFFDKQGGSGGSDQVLVIYNNPLPTIATPIKENYIFKGYFSELNGQGTQYYYANGTGARNYDKENDITLYAYWQGSTPSQYATITFDANGGYSDESARIIEKDQPIGELPNATRLNYIFLGWFTHRTGGEQIHNSTIFSIDTTIYAHWEYIQPETVTITFDANGGSPATQQKTIVKDHAIEQFPEQPIKLGYTFLGWFTQLDGGEQIYSYTTFSADTTVYAHWKKDELPPAMPLYLYDDVKLSIIKNVNSRILNQSFRKLAANDIGIFPINNYIPNIWENKWFNDDSIAGYQKGDVVWKGTMTFKSFLSNYYGLIRDYADGCDKLNSYFKLDPENWEDEIPKYQNAVSGYSMKVGTGVSAEWKQVLPMMFDPGNLDDIDSTMSNTKISIYISMLDDNKAFLSDTAAWKQIALTSDSAFSAYISTEIDLMFKEHVKDFHLAGSKTEDEFDAALMRKDFSNFDPDELYGAPQIRNHGLYFNGQGIDYVVKFVKSPFPWSLSSTYTLYRWFRLWNSGYLEHGGYVEFPLIDEISSSQVSNYTANVPLNWTYDDDLSATYYDYPTVANNLYGDMHKLLYFRNGIEQKLNADERVLGKDKRYSVSLTPVDFLSSYIHPNTDELSGKYYSISSIGSESFLSSPQISNSKNYPYLNTEIHLLKNDSFYVTRSLIDDGELSDRHVNLLQYYVSGYRSSTKRNYNIFDCTVINLLAIYSYTGEQIMPDPILKSNDGMTLELNIDYTVQYGDNISGNGYMTFIGNDPWRGSMLCSFAIRENLDGAFISGISSAYEYGKQD